MKRRKKSTGEAKVKKKKKSWFESQYKESCTNYSKKKEAYVSREHSDMTAVVCMLSDKHMVMCKCWVVT